MGNGKWQMELGQAESEFSSELDNGSSLTRRSTSVSVLSTVRGEVLASKVIPAQVELQTI